MALAITTKVSQSSRRALFFLWLLGALCIIALVGGGEDEFATRAAILERAALNDAIVEATAVRQIEVPVVRLTRKGPRRQALTCTEFSYIYQQHHYTSNAPGKWEAGTRLQIHFDASDPSTIYTGPPASLLRELKLNHYGTMLTNKVFMLSMFSFFLGIIYKLKNEPRDAAIRETEP